jgi:rhodanese-related sulfurtransferase
MDERDKKNNKIIVIGAILIAMVFAYTIFKAEFLKEDSKNMATKKDSQINYPKMAPEDIKIKSKNDDTVQFVDIRGSDDYKLEHLINSISATSEEALSGVSRDKTIIIIGYEEQKESYPKAIEFFRSAGFKEVYVLDGGILAWKEIGGSTISIGNPNSFVDTSKIIYILPEELKKIIEDQAYPKYILDVSSKQAFDSGHLAGAENIILDNLEKSADKIPSEKEIFVYGENDLQGFQAGVRLYDLGIMSMKVLKGGLPAWKEKKFEVVK